MHPKLFTCCLLLLFSFRVFAQQATVTGKVVAPNQTPLESASVGIKNTTTGTLTNAQGIFKLSVPADKDIVLIIKYINYREQQVNLKLKAGEQRNITVLLTNDTTALQTVTITGRNPNNARDEVSITRLEPRVTKQLPTPFGEFNKILVTLPGVVSNNELSSTYSVRGGNYDENLVYVNGIEIYRPFLVSNAQQEGLSFINPDLVDNIEFSAGGWQPKYGDKLSSVLNIDYKIPTHFAGSVTGGLLGGAAHLEGTTRNKRFTYLVGTRYKNAQLLFNRSLQTSGNYQPRFGDIQGYFNLNLGKKDNPERTTLGFVGSLARNKYLVIPSLRETTFGTVNQYVRLRVAYEGRERMEYDAYQGGLNLQHRFNDAYTAHFIISSLLSRERELRNIEAGYNFCDIDLDPNSPDFNNCVQQRDAGTEYNYARNNLDARIFALETRHIWELNNRNQVQWGLKWSRERLQDILDEYRFVDSADFVDIRNVLKTNIFLNSDRFSGYAQQTLRWAGGKTLTYGVRANYWSYNKDLTVSPRVQYAFVVPNNKQLSFKFAVGVYHQPPFYRELRDLAGDLNQNLKAQQSVHFIAGNEYRFKAWNRDFKLTTEAYYKYLTNVIPYEVDNVRLRYYAKNNAKAYVVGFDTRINGEFIKGAESWFSLGIMSARENIAGDSANIYDPKTRNVIGREPLGYIRRPTDQRVTLGIFFQDQLPNDPTVKMNLNLVYGTGLPFSPPGIEGIRNHYNMPGYKRVDIGFSKLITLRHDNESKFGLESLWLGLEVLNLLATNNVVSYNYVQDVNQITYAVPNYLSSRLLNLRFITRF
ncbi:TonB-dependent receptor [Adhaeribacter rhizoryzae]|uniref:TonB-dependent receptor n=1 Tax=Adhaeribacter rhizoryzae TaxID=2607907 RepID=A0A5M6DJW5_9BACT|nr:TonB-dependent receptor [Adhaeribacter rhizoryzae]KAA5547743.1 TonB-dependent receptor [Adhaeribacter rhizoryzae]